MLLSLDGSQGQEQMLCVCCGPQLSGAQQASLCAGHSNLSLPALEMACITSASVSCPEAALRLAGLTPSPKCSLSSATTEGTLRTDATVTTALLPPWAFLRINMTILHRL